jgi:transcriptional regulator with XRE-family HTH domain
MLFPTSMALLLSPCRARDTRIPTPSSSDRFFAATGWTIAALAQQAGMNAQYLGIVENGGNVTTLTTILQVCEVLGADAGEMIREVAAARRMPKVTGRPLTRLPNP